MSTSLEICDGENGALAIMHEGKMLFRYVYESSAPVEESPRPYIHPLSTLSGDVLTNFRPNDHPWHHGLSLTLTNVNGINFWGGPTYAPADGYKFRDNFGVQRHRDWLRRSPTSLVHTLDWIEQKTARTLLEETRTLEIHVNRSEESWSLRWTSVLKNCTPETLTLGNYHASNGLKGSHYTGLQFRGARALLDEHGDATINIFAEGGHVGEQAVHGVRAHWMDWHTQHDTTLRRTRVRFENLTGPLHWFVRRGNPLAAFPVYYDQPHNLEPQSALTLDHRLTFSKI